MIHHNCALLYSKSVMSSTRIMAKESCGLRILKISSVEHHCTGIASGQLFHGSLLVLTKEHLETRRWLMFRKFLPKRPIILASLETVHKDHDVCTLWRPLPEGSHNCARACCTVKPRVWQANLCAIESKGSTILTWKSTASH